MKTVAGNISTMSAIPKVLVRSPITAGYKALPGRSGFMSMIRDGRPWLTWQDIEGMRRDPMVSLGLRILRAPIAQVTFKSYADNPRISKFSLMQLKRFWRNSLGHALTAFDYGNSAAEPLYRFRRRLQQFDRLNRLSVHDVRALEYAKGTRNGEFAGLRVRRLRGGSATDDLVSPWCFWLALDPEPGTIAGISRLHAVLEPWREKRGRHGAVDSRRLYHHKCAFTGGMFRYPEGSTNLGTEETPRLVPNQDIAREVLEKFENGGILVLPNTKDPVTGDFLWNVEFAQYLGDAPGLLEYPQILDKEIMTGLGIPPEIVEASTVGSGYSGRAIPAQVFFASLDEVVNQLLTAVSEQIIKPLVEANFGPNQWFEIEAQSLAEKVAGQPSYTESKITDSVDKPNRQPQPMDQDASGDGDQLDPLDALRQAASGPQRLSNEALARRLGMSERAVEAAALEAERLFPQLSRITRTTGGLTRLGWESYTGTRGGKGWRNTGTGEIRYQKEKPGDDDAADDKPPAEKSKTPKRLDERGDEIARAHWQNMRALLGKMKRGEYHPEDVLNDAPLMAERAANAVASNVMSNYVRWKQVVEETRDADAIRSDEWKAVAAAFETSRDELVQVVNDMANVAVINARENVGKDTITIRADASELLGELHDDLVSGHVKAANAIGDALEKFVAKWPKSGQRLSFERPPQAKRVES